MDGIQVAMATHKGSQWITRALHSVTDVLQGHDWVMAVAIDGYDQITYDVLKDYRNRNNGRHDPHKFLFHQFPKSKGVGQAKNAALAMLREYTYTHPWILLMDDDDEMLPSRVDFLLANAKRRGSRFAVADWTMHRAGTGEQYHYCDSTINAHISSCGFTPCATVIHSSVLPPSGHLFNEDDTYNEDAKQWSRMAADAFDWQVFPGVPVYRHLEDRALSISRPSDRPVKERMLIDNVTACGRTRREPKCVCCFVTRGYERDFLMFHFTLRLHYNGHLVVMCTKEVAALVKNTVKNATVVVTEINPKLFTHEGIWLTKARVMEYAMSVYDDVLYLDSDIMVMEQFYLPQDGWDVCMTGHFGSQDERYGIHNGAFIACCNKNMLPKWHSWILNTKAEWKTFADQWEQSTICRDFKTIVLPRSYNIAPWQRYPMKIDAGYGLYSDGDLLRCVHTHLFGHQWGGAECNKNMVKFNGMLTDGLSRGKLPKHQQILKYYNDLK